MNTRIFFLALPVLWAVSLPMAHGESALLAYDAMLDRGTGEVTAAVEQGDWIGATEAMARLQTTCVSCHMQWRGKARRSDARAN